MPLIMGPTIERKMVPTPSSLLPWLTHQGHPTTPPPAPKGINEHYPAQPSAVGRAHVLPDDSLQARCPPGALPCSSQLEGPCASSELSAQRAVPPGTPRPIIPRVAG